MENDQQDSLIFTPSRPGGPSNLIYQVIPKIMAEIGAVGKKGKNTQQNYQYRAVDDIYESLQLLLAKYGVFTVPTVLKDETEERQTKSGTNLIYRKLTIKYRFYATDGSYFESVVVGEGMDSGDKASNKAMSVAHKYALVQVFCIPTKDPKDPEIDHHEVSPKKKAPAGYNPGNDGHVKALEVALGKTKIPKDKWLEIQDKLTGRPYADLPEILKEYQT
jgi:hypothetical protein